MTWELRHNFQMGAMLDFHISAKLQKTTRIDRDVIKTNGRSLRWAKYPIQRYGFALSCSDVQIFRLSVPDRQGTLAVLLC